MKAVALAFKERLPLENGFRTVAQSILWAVIHEHRVGIHELFITPMPNIRHPYSTFNDYLCALRSELSPYSKELADEVEERCEFVEVFISVPGRQFKTKHPSHDRNERSEPSN
jgi:hypothetical protein